MVAMDGVCMEGCKNWKLLGIPTGENHVNQVNRKSHFKVIFNEIAFLFQEGKYPTIAHRVLGLAPMAEPGLRDISEEMLTRYYKLKFCVH